MLRCESCAECWECDRLRIEVFEDRTAMQRHSNFMLKMRRILKHLVAAIKTEAP